MPLQIHHSMLSWTLSLPSTVPMLLLSLLSWHTASLPLPSDVTLLLRFSNLFILLNRIPWGGDPSLTHLSSSSI